MKGAIARDVLPVAILELIPISVLWNIASSSGEHTSDDRLWEVWRLIRGSAGGFFIWTISYLTISQVGTWECLRMTRTSLQTKTASLTALEAQNHITCGNAGLAISHPGEVEDLLSIWIISAWIQLEGGNQQTQEENSTSVAGSRTIWPMPTLFATIALSYRTF